MCTNLLKTAVWNIEGLTTDKINDPHFNKIISQFQIISFIETWTNDVDVNEISIPGFCFVDSNNRKKHHKARRNSGGINIFAKNSISKGIKKLPKYHTDILWIKIDHNFFKLDKDIYIATVYMSPENSSTNITGLEPIYDKLLADVVKYSNLGHIIVQGDFNAYTNTKPDFVAFDNSCTSNQDDLQYISDQNIPRNNLDTKLVNNSGKYLLNLCKESGLRILNGRTIGDLHGKHTCITYNGCSVVDYMLVSKELLHIVGYFEVHDFTSLSNHCIISCSLLIGFIMPQNTPQYQLDPIPNKFIWTPEAINLYTLNSNSIESKNKFEQFLKSTFKDSESAVNSFNTILYENALKSAKLVKKVPVRNKNQNRLKRRPWYSESCRELGVTVKNYAKLVNKHPYNSEYRHKFYSFRSRLRRLCKYEENKYKKRYIFRTLYM
ncbi:unnamed protein product [Mytilus edulis]|uniref:Endonuclease/exonuclease/phosphatase domain-containing protein n=1 Tax=Mytilus edulis TaxID=6550 RepID=A0A8S3THI1_MYTED|nr:unnamed protein product [Mytilus edulis]